LKRPHYKLFKTLLGIIASGLNWFVLVGLTFLSFQASATNYCGLTLNSSTEFDLFRKTYGQSIDKARFIELTDYIAPSLGGDSKKSPRQWLKKACEAGVKCDVLIISGHFAGDFFGRSQISLPLEDLEEVSCLRECDGIFKQPKEVFLLGCNTMAGKGVRTESMESYIQRLTEHYSDQFSHPSQIERVAAFRYLPFGLSYAERMRRIFDKPVKLYGFDATAPTGNQIAPLLNHYFKMVGPSYDKHLMSLKKGTKNQKLATVLKGSTFVEMDQAPRGYAPVCVMKNANMTKEERLAWIERSLLTEDWISFAPAISRYFKEVIDITSSQVVDNKVNQIFQRIRTNKAIYDRVVGTLKDPRFKNIVSIRFELVRLLEVLGFDSAQLKENYRGMIISSFPTSAAAVANSKQTLCAPDYSPLARASLSLQDIKALHGFYLKNPKPKGQVGETTQSWLTEVLMCLGPSQKEVLTYMTDELLKEIKGKKIDPSSSMFGPVLSAISQNTSIPGALVSRILGVNQDASVFAIENLMANQKIMDHGMSQLVLKSLKDNSTRVMMLQALTTSKTDNLEVHQALLEMHRNQSLSAEGRELLKRVIREMEPIHTEIQLEIIKIYLKKGASAVEPRALGRASQETRKKLDEMIRSKSLTEEARARLLRLLVVASPTHPSLKEFVLAHLGTADSNRQALVSHILSEAMVTYIDKDVRDLIIKSWRSGHRVPGTVKYLTQTTQHNMELLAELLDAWNGLKSSDPLVSELKALVESRLAWRPEVLSKIFSLLEGSREDVQLYLVEFFRMADIPEDYRKDVVYALEVLVKRPLRKSIKTALLEILPVMRVDAGLKK